MTEGNIGFRIFERKNFLPDELLEKYKAFSSANVGDAMGFAIKLCLKKAMYFPAGFL